MSGCPCFSIIILETVPFSFAFSGVDTSVSPLSNSVDLIESTSNASFTNDNFNCTPVKLSTVVNCVKLTSNVSPAFTVVWDVESSFCPDVVSANAVVGNKLSIIQILKIIVNNLFLNLMILFPPFYLYFKLHIVICFYGIKSNTLL